MTQSTAPGPGIYYDVPAEVYHSWPFASNSRLGKLVPPSTPAHLKTYLEEPPVERRSWREGRVVHARVLEPKMFKRDYVLAQQCQADTAKGDQCSKEGTARLKRSGEWLCAIHQRPHEEDDFDHDLVVLKPADKDLAEGIAKAVHAHPTAGAFLAAEGGATEVSLVWDDPETGVRCKARLDYYNPELAGGVAMDLKSTVDASPQEFARHAFKFGYMRQGTFYLWGLKELELPCAHYSIVAAEKAKPHAVAVHRITEQAIGGIPGPGEPAYHCAGNVRALLRVWDRCQKTGIYPAYPDEVQDLSLPEWAWTAMENQTTKLLETLAA